MTTDDAIAIVRQCPQCGHDDTYLFHHVSDPAIGKGMEAAVPIT